MPQTALTPAANAGADGRTLTQVLRFAVTRYDRKRVNRKDYNRYALGQYLRAVDDIMREWNAGSTATAAIERNTNDRLRDVCLKAAAAAGY